MKRDFIDVRTLNKEVERDYRKVILDAESKYRGQLFKLADQCTKRKASIILFAGPSCAGKTTSARLIKEILEKQGKDVIIIGMDDFFLNREDTPLLPNGDKDFDSLRAVNLTLMEQCFTKLFTTGKAGFPKFDFIDGVSIPEYYQLEFKRNTIIILEGLHVLNPELLKCLHTAKMFRVYASAMSGFQLGDIRMSTRQLRLVRRMIRDAQRRGHPPAKTLRDWKNVCDAEDSYISPFKEDVDFHVNTTHAFELGLYKESFFQIIITNREVMKDLPFIEVIEHALRIDKAELPDTTLMWEFIDPPESNTQARKFRKELKEVKKEKKPKQPASNKKPSGTAKKKKAKK